MFYCFYVECISLLWLSMGQPGELKRALKLWWCLVLIPTSLWEQEKQSVKNNRYTVRNNVYGGWNNWNMKQENDCGGTNFEWQWNILSFTIVEKLIWSTIGLGLLGVTFSHAVSNRSQWDLESPHSYSILSVNKCTGKRKNVLNSERSYLVLQR